MPLPCQSMQERRPVLFAKTDRSCEAKLACSYSDHMSLIVIGSSSASRTIYGSHAHPHKDKMPSDFQSAMRLLSRSALQTPVTTLMTIRRPWTRIALHKRSHSAQLALQLRTLNKTAVSQTLTGV